MNIYSHGRIIVAFFLAVFVMLVFSQADKKFVLDELDFPIVAKATSEKLKPIYYRGEGHEEHLGLYHPPLYIYMLGAHIKIFGFSENTVRSFGLFCTLITTLLTAILGSRISQLNPRLFIPIFVALYLSSPYTIANTTLPDIDQSILPPLFVLYLIFLFENKRDQILLVAFTVLLWTKLTTPLALIPFSLIYWYFQKQSISEIVSRGIRVFGGALLAFIISYSIYCELFDLPFFYTFDFLFHSFSKGSGATDFSQVVDRIFQNFGYSVGFLAWITYPFVFLFGISFVFNISKLKIDPNAPKILGLSCLTLFVTVFYCGLIAPFGGFFKYPFPVFELACLVISLTAVSCMRIDLRVNYYLVALIFISGFYLLFIQIQNSFDHKMIADFFEKKLLVDMVSFFLVLGITVLFLILSRRFSAIFVALMLGSIIGLGLGVSRTHSISPYPTKYNYGQLGFDDTVAYLKQRLQPDETIWSMKDIGFYTGDRYIESYSYYFDSEVEKKILSLAKKNIRYFVATKQIGEDQLDAYPLVLASLEKCCFLDKVFGNYYIYRKK